MKKCSEIKIEKGVPIPVSGRGYANALRTMGVGDSFVVPSGKRNSVISNKHLAGEGKDFISRTISPTEARIWRIK